MSSVSGRCNDVSLCSIRTFQLKLFRFSWEYQIIYFHISLLMWNEGVERNKCLLSIFHWHKNRCVAFCTACSLSSTKELVWFRVGHCMPHGISYCDKDSPSFVPRETFTRKKSARYTCELQHRDVFVKFNLPVSYDSWVASEAGWFSSAKLLQQVLNHSKSFQTEPGLHGKSCYR